MQERDAQIQEEKERLKEELAAAQNVSYSSKIGFWI